MLKHLRISTKLVGVIGVTVLAASLAVGVFVFRGAERALYTQTIAHLEAERGSRGRMVSAYFQRLRDQMGISSRQLVTQITLRDMRTVPPASAEHERLRALFHPYARGLVQAFKHPDILLVDLDGVVHYSYTGTIDASTNLRSGPLRDSGAGQAFAHVADAPIDTVDFVDYQPFAPARNAAAGFTATPVFDADGTTRLGVLIIRIAPDEISAIMTDSAGFGATGETYLVGPDLLMRSNSRFAASDTVLKQAIRTEGGRRGLAGETGAIEQTDYRGARVLAAFAPIDILGVQWAIVAKIDKDEALAPARSFELRLVALIVVVGLVATLVLWEALRRIVLSPAAALAAGASRVAARDYSQPVALTTQDELGELGRAFDTMMGAVGTQVDELKRARAAAQLGQRLLEAAPDAVVVVNDSGRMVVVNAAAERLFGYTRAELLEQHIEALVPESSRAAHTGHRDSYFAKPSTRGMGTGFELQGRRKDGSLVPVEISLSPLESADGRLAVAAVRDITERRAAERNLKESEERLAAAASGANLGLWDVDPSSGTVLVNSIFESQLGYAPLALRESDAKWAALRGGLPGWTALIHPDDRARVIDLIERFLGGKDQVYTAEHRVLRGDGTFSWILSVGNTVARDDAGRPVRVNGVHIEISAMKGLQLDLEHRYHELQELQQLRDGLVHMIIHDLRSPLSSVMGYLDLLRTETNEAAETRARFVEHAYGGASDMSELISTLLDINRMEAREMPVDRQAADLTELANDAVRALGGLAVGRKVSVTNTSPVGSNCDPGLIRRVIGNLLGNALKFTPASGSITITASSDGRTARVEVADTGPGIPADFLGRVFDKFSQASEGRSRKRYSTGLGLTFCKLAIEAHGGTIGVTSEVGVGTQFWFELPQA